MNTELNQYPESTPAVMGSIARPKRGVGTFSCISKALWPQDVFLMVNLSNAISVHIAREPLRINPDHVFILFSKAFFGKFLSSGSSRITGTWHQQTLRYIYVAHPADGGALLMGTDTIFLHDREFGRDELVKSKENRIRGF